MTRTFKETPSFTNKWHEAGLSDEILRELQNSLLENPKLGDAIQGTGGLRKIRIPLEDTGKRGGGRVIYVDVEIKDTIHLIDVYLKTEKKDLTPDERKVLKRLVQILREED